VSSVPEFPKTRPVALEDKALFDRALRAFPPTVSELTFTNIFAWRRAYRFEVSAAGDYLLLFSLKDGRPSVFDPLGPALGKKKILGGVLGSGPVKAIRLPGSTGELFDEDKAFTVREDRDNADYLYRASDLIGLKGADYDGKRNLIKRFKEAVSFSYKELTPDRVEECLDFEEEWCLEKDCQHVEGLAREREAMEEMLRNFKALGICGGMVEIGGKVEAVTLGEALNPETFVVHVEKANGRNVGIYQTVNQLFCADKAAPYSFVNREQDLGVEGLRKAKESYHPCAMVMKYTVERV
jgi:hypothetical protein